MVALIALLFAGATPMAASAAFGQSKMPFEESASVKSKSKMAARMELSDVGRCTQTSENPRPVTSRKILAGLRQPRDQDIEKALRIHFHRDFAVGRNVVSRSAGALQLRPSAERRARDLLPSPRSCRR